jgi:hypothetical protein
VYTPDIETGGLSSGIRKLRKRALQSPLRPTAIPWMSERTKSFLPMLGYDLQLDVEA